jgi:hypothetical protein
MMSLKWIPSEQGEREGEALVGATQAPIIANPESL